MEVLELCVYCSFQCGPKNHGHFYEGAVFVLDTNNHIGHVHAGHMSKCATQV